MRKRPQRLNTIAALTALLASFGMGASAQTLMHRYSFNEAFGSPSFADSVGGGSWAGALAGAAYLDGTTLQLDGYGSFATLPAGMISTLPKVTIEFWATFRPENPVWTRTFSFGDQDGSGGKVTGLDYCHYAGGDWQNLGFTTAGANVWANNPGGINGQTNVHVTVIVDPANNQMYYYNGTSVRSNPGVNNGTVPALSALNDTFGLLGKSLYDIDATLTGSFDEFRVYNGVLSASQVVLNEAAGPNNYFSDPGALQAVHLASPDNPLVVNQNSPQLFTGDFANVSGVNLGAYGGAAFSSGNSGVLTVNASGVVKAMAPGTTTVIASFGGLSATNTLTVVAIPAVLQHRYSFAANANDSVGNAHGTLQGTATVTGGKAVLDGQAGTYVDLPADIINIATNRAVTIEAWVDLVETPAWSRLFNFGNDGGSSEIYLAPRGPGNGEQHRLSQNLSGGRTIDWIGGLSNTTAHLTCVIDPPTSTLAIYLDGALEYARYDAAALLSLVSTNLAVLGRSLVAADAYLPGSIDEFRIYSGALSPQEIALTHKNGVGSTARDPGALQAIKVPATVYPAFSRRTPPTVLATYANLTNFNLVPNNSMVVNGLTITSSDTNVIQVLANNMVRTFRPGKATLTATYQGKTDSAVVTVQNVAKLEHRYPFTTGANDVVGNAHGTFKGAATAAGGSLVLDGTADTYLELPPGILAGYDAITVDAWVTFNTAATWARLWYFGDDRANELYLAPSVLGGASHWFSTGFPFGGDTITISPRWENETVHITCVYGNGVMEYYTNGVLHGGVPETTGRPDEIGKRFSWIGRSPHPDPFMNCTVDEFRIYRGRLSAEEIMAAQVIGSGQLLSTAPALAAAAAGGSIDVRWPVGAAGFVVQGKSSLGGGEWVTLTNAPALIDNQWHVTVPAGNGPQFFRLWR